MQIEVATISKDQWRRYRAIRLSALQSDPEAFGGTYENSLLKTAEQWQENFETLTPVIASVGNQDVGMLTIENLEGDFGATCWIGGCWVDPNFRNKSVMRKIFEYLDWNAAANNWQVQGLGVWQHNFDAIKAYEKLKFVSMGDPVPSTSKPGLFYQRMIRKAI